MSGIVFFGTPDFAVPSLDALCEAGRRPELVVAQPTRPVGRSGEMTPPPVAVRASELGLPLSQPESVAGESFLADLRTIGPEWGVVVAFGQIFRPALLDLPSRGCLNVHASLLPRYRGAAPIQAALAAGDRETGVTIMRMDTGLDTGPVVLQRRLDIGSEETAPELSRRLSLAGGAALVEAIDGLEAGTFTGLPQDGARATYAPRLSRADGRIDWSMDADRIADRLRAFTPWPGLFLTWNDERVKVFEVRVGEPDGGEGAEDPGTILELEPPGFWVRCGSGSRLAVMSVQRPGRKVTDGVDFVRGSRLAVGDRFG